jgi:hypothetical protein
MSKFEANEFVDDRYAKMSERLEVRRNERPHFCSVLLLMEMPYGTDHALPSSS